MELANAANVPAHTAWWLALSSTAIMRSSRFETISRTPTCQSGAWAMHRLRS